MAHTDISPSQYIKVNGVYKLNDFNRARFIAYDSDGRMCPYYIGVNGGKNRSPEEYKYEAQTEKVRCSRDDCGRGCLVRQSAQPFFLLFTVPCFPLKVDLYSLGNIFFMLLQGDWPFDDVSSDTAHALVINGTRPTIYMDLWYSDDPVNKALKEVMMMCHEHDPADRPSARQVEAFLMDKMRELDPGHLETWGLAA